MLNIIDEHSRECLAMVPLRRFRSNDVIEVLSNGVQTGPPIGVKEGPPYRI
jgi:hypothetical protein